MIEAPLAGAEVKLNRAREHLKRLRSESAEFLEGDPYRLIVEFDPKSGWHFVKARIVEEAPVELGVTVGEFAYECISALNHVAWQLAARKRGRIAVEKIKREVQFPVALSPQAFEKEPLIARGHISKAAVAVLHELQPYHRFNGVTRATTHSLALLKELADSDKHRVLAPRWGSLDLGKLRLGWTGAADSPEGGPYRRKYKTVGDGARLMRIRFAVGNDEAKVYVDGDLAPEIAFGAGGFLLGTGHLDSAIGYMGRAMQRLATLFPSQ